ncbi:hypothetical protein AB4Z32_17505 [Massilia sp. 2TAF26]|uniref:hypothetical protein n=1 Tax=Massilia sp. 2TAF26 TaxID=3233012 RepID=UPI003F98C0F0
MDSASERTYQAAFVHMLNAQGYRVLHSTRHCALEYGKDVIAIDPDGVPCAFQLKGNGGGRLTLNGFREVQSQLIQLLSQPIIFPGIDPKAPHRAFLVSNGYYDEEVQRAVDDLNRGGYRSQLELLSRGDLLAWVKDSNVQVWPSELVNIKGLLEMALHDGRDLLPLGRLASLLEEILALRDTDNALRQAELYRAVSSAALVTGICLNNFEDAENHLAVAFAWVLFSVNVIGACTRAALPPNGRVKAALDLADEAIKDALVALFDEANDNPSLVEGDPFADVELQNWRRCLLNSLFSALCYFPDESEEARQRKNSIREWIKSSTGAYVWGEGAVPASLIHWFALRELTGDNDAWFEKQVGALLRLIMSSNQIKSDRALPVPYYDFATILRARLGLLPTDESVAFQADSFAGNSFMAEGLMHLLAAMGDKEECVSAWANFTRLGHKRFVPDVAWQYCLLHAEGGVEETRQYRSTYEWSQLLDDACKTNCTYLPSVLKDRRHILMLWVIMFPYRMTSDIVRVLFLEG